MNRSFLFVPADDEHKLQRAGEVDADAVILDLEDSVVADARSAARDLARAYRRGPDSDLGLEPVAYRRGRKTGIQFHRRQR